VNESLQHEDILVALKVHPRDRGLWGEFYRRIRPAVYYTLFKITRGNAGIADDLTHEAFLRFMERADISLFPDETRAIAYLRQMGRNLYRNRLRKERIFNSTTEEASLALASAAYDDEDRQHLRWDLEQLASDLPRAERDVLEALIEGLNIQEIAARERLTYGAAAVRIHRLKKNLFRSINKLKKGL
jgi:RNA polymerase sigma factor (sigma-70 family)